MAHTLTARLVSVETAVMALVELLWEEPIHLLELSAQGVCLPECDDEPRPDADNLNQALEWLCMVDWVDERNGLYCLTPLGRKSMVRPLCSSWQMAEPVGER